MVLATKQSDMSGTLNPDEEPRAFEYKRMLVQRQTEFSHASVSSTLECRI
jgi:hypothetical protein